MAQGGGISGFAEGAGIGSGLARSRTGGTLLRRPETVSSRPPPQDDETYPSLSDDPEVRAQGAGNTILAGLIPRFVRLSALVALELGREVSAEEIGPSSGSGSGPDNNRDRVAGAGVALVPTVQWYSLLASLLTHAVLEGYLTAEWRGLAPLQVLLGLGLGDAAIPHDANDEDSAVPRSPAVMVEDKYVEFEPDGMPDLSDAVDVLFPGRRANASVGGRRTGNASDGGGEEERGENSDRVGGRMNDNAARRGGGEAEYAREMGQRLARVCENRLLPPFHWPSFPVLFCCPHFFALRVCLLLSPDWWFPAVPWVIDRLVLALALVVLVVRWKPSLCFCLGNSPCRVGPDHTASFLTSPQARGILQRI